MPEGATVSTQKPKPKPGRHRPDEQKLSTQVWVQKSVEDRSAKTLDEEGEQELIEVHQFVTEPTVVNIAFGYTHNLGNYRSARCTVGISRPCYSEEEEACMEKLVVDISERFEAILKSLLISISNATE